MSALWSRDPLLLALLVALGAAWATTHLAMTVSVLRSELPLPLRLLALLPPAAPVLGMFAGARWRVALWLATGAAYVTIRWGVG